MSEWKAIENAPKDGTKILAYGTGVDGGAWPVDKPMPNQFSVCWWTEHEVEIDIPVGEGLFRKEKQKVLGNWRGTNLAWFKPTHWMPLPDAP